MQVPLGRPGGVLDQVLMRVACHGIFVVDTVMPQLIDVCIPFVGNALTLTIHINAAERSGLDAIFTQILYRVEYGVRRVESGCVIIKRVVNKDLANS